MILLVRSLILIVCWLVLWRAAVLMEYAQHASLWFPPAGLTFAATLIMGVRAIPALTIACLVSTFWMADLYGFEEPHSELLKTGLLFALAHVGSYWLGACGLRCVLKRVKNSDISTAVLGFLIMATLSSLLAAWLGTLTMSVEQLLTASTIWDTWLPWWIGDLNAVIVLGPICVAVISWRYATVDKWLTGLNLNLTARTVGSFLTKLVMVVGFLVAILLLVDYSDREEAAFAIFFLILPLLWISYTEPPIYTASSITLFSVTIATAVNVLNLMDYALVFQFAITVIAASSWFGVAVPTILATNEALNTRIDRDTLTHASSREFFIRQLEEQIAKARRHRQPLSVIVLDVDKFKSINDNFGHIIGDEVLVAVTKSIDEQLRGSDLLGRFGGDEFMIMLCNTPLELANQTAERLRHVVANLRVGAKGVTVTCSFGVVELKHEEHVMEVIDRADKALFTAKRAGRNQVETQQEEPAVNLMS